MISQTTVGRIPRDCIDRQLHSPSAEGCASSRGIPRTRPANIDAPVFMIAQKAGDLIRDRPPLPAEQHEYCRAPTIGPTTG